MPDSPQVGLALCGGAARGFAHLGILDYFKEKNYPIAQLAGCSMGSIVSSLTALGKSVDDIIKISDGFKFRNILQLTWPRMGFSKIDKMKAYIQSVFGQASFEECVIPLRLVAADLDTGEEIIFDKGLIWPGVMASSCIPCIFEPFEWEGRRLSDGGLIRLNPTYCLRDAGLDAIIGSDVGLVRQREGQVEGMIDYLKQCLELLVQGQRQQSELVSDLTLKPDIRTKPLMKFDRIQEYRELGYQCCVKEEKALAEIFSTK